MSWQKDIRNSLKNAKECNAFFNTNLFTDNDFALKIPIDFANLININNQDKSLLNQVISSKKDNNYNFESSPLNDEQHSPIKGVIHKHYNRVLLIISGTCAIHCQYCFRQNFDYKNTAIDNWQNTLEYLYNNQHINEVIFSGGDPLSLADDKLELLIDDIIKINHIKTIRIHSRTLSIVPSRITDKLVNIINNSSIKIVLVTHINHFNELSAQFINKIQQIKCTIFNQSVLLKGVNDDAAILIKLSNSLFAINIIPYYLHMLDKVSGSEKFLVDDKGAMIIYKNMQNKLSGYLLPKLVRDDKQGNKAIIA